MADESKDPGWRVEGSPRTPPKDGGSGKRPPGLGRRLLIFVGVLLALNWLTVVVFAPGHKERVQIPYSPTFLAQVTAGNVKAISSKGETLQGQFVKKYKGDTDFGTEVPTFANTDQLSKLLEQHNVEINAKPITSDRPLLVTILLSFGPTLLFVGLLIMLMRRAQPGGMLASLGRSKARRSEDAEHRVTFADVAGIDEAEDELIEIVDFLKHPDKYRRLGAKIPRGVLLSGQPGTGKTLLARAVAGEAGVPFFSISASEFVEVIVGVGASRVRDLFKEAKANAPAIVFIDELDAIGRARSASAGIQGGHDEREQTLNQILTEMDGFDPAIGVIVMAATNRPEILDPALLRPGRFDRRIPVLPPDRLGRRLILDVHTRSVPMDPEVDLDRIAASTPGMVGADIANLVNEAALLAAKRGHDSVHQEDFTDAIEKIVLGTARKVVMSQADRERTAYHEAGHAVVGMLTEGADPVRKVSIIPRGQALGVTLSTPDADRYNYSREELIARIKVALGGRAAELIVYGDVTTGAESDIRQLTMIARSMVMRWGMSATVGPVFLDSDNPYGIEQRAEPVEDEVRRIVESAEEETVALLRDNRGKLDSLVARLLEKETIDQDEVYEVVGMEPESPAEADPAPAPTAAA
jgi:cell division protease FtsH